VTDRLRLVRDALTQLAMEPEAQRAALVGAVVTDELALDLDHAVRSLPQAAVAPAVLAELRKLNRGFDVPPGDALWNDASLDTHPVWAAARETARRLLKNLQRAPTVAAIPSRMRSTPWSNDRSA
jgi:hypothetical protein